MQQLLGHLQSIFIMLDKKPLEGGREGYKWWRITSFLLVEAGLNHDSSRNLLPNVHDKVQGGNDAMRDKVGAEDTIFVGNQGNEDDKLIRKKVFEEENNIQKLFCHH